VTSPNPHYTPNPERAIYVHGTIDQALIHRLTPQIISLQNQSREPITVYIDSPGGIVIYMESLLNLLRASNQQYEQPCRLITVVTSLAASAAADMLASGNYALAYPDSTILYHGVRLPGDRALTVEETLQLAQRLRVGNENYAMKLAREAEFRAVFRYITHKSQFQKIRDENPDRALSDLDCFIHIISEHLSESASEVLGKARERHGRYSALLLHVMRANRSKRPYKTTVDMEAADIKAIVEFERRQNRKNEHWSFLGEGIHRLTDDVFLLYEYLNMFRSERFRALCQMFADFLLSADELEAINQTMPEEDRPQKIVEAVRPQLRPIWSFFVALCHVLQQGENQLTATDAFWLGLIDEVIGVKDLPSFRLMAEFAEQQRAKAAQVGSGNAGELATGTGEEPSQLTAPEPPPS
jgi:ATP-dependent protease ClpP protease subunit